MFRALWIASLASNLGAWIQNVGASWLMTSLAPDPLVVSLVQVASSLPFFLLAIPAGALADVVDRRRQCAARPRARRDHPRPGGARRDPIRGRAERHLDECGARGRPRDRGLR